MRNGFEKLSSVHGAVGKTENAVKSRVTGSVPSAIGRISATTALSKDRISQETVWFPP